MEEWQRILKNHSLTMEEFKRCFPMYSKLVSGTLEVEEDADMSLSAIIRNWFLKPVLTKLNQMETIMANEADVLNQVASELASNVFPAVQALVDRNRELEAQAAAQAGEEAQESEAVTNVVNATKRVSDLLAPTEAPTPAPVTDGDSTSNE